MLATSPRCLGCTFQAAASEFPELDPPGHRVALAHKGHARERFAELARLAGLRDPDGLGDQLLLLMDGAWVAARMFGPDNHATSVAAAARTLIEAHVSTPLSTTTPVEAASFAGRVPTDREPVD